MAEPAAFADVFVRFHLPLKTKSVAFISALFASLIGLAVGPVAADQATPVKPALKRPTLKVDASPIGESKTVVTSYADALETIRPAVVSV